MYITVYFMLIVKFECILKTLYFYSPPICFVSDVTFYTLSACVCASLNQLL